MRHVVRSFPPRANRSRQVLPPMRRYLRPACSGSGHTLSLFGLCMWCVCRWVTRRLIATTWRTLLGHLWWRHLRSQTVRALCRRSSGNCASELNLHSLLLSCNVSASVVPAVNLHNSVFCKTWLLLCQCHCWKTRPLRAWRAL